MNRYDAQAAMAEKLMAEQRARIKLACQYAAVHGATVTSIHGDHVIEWPTPPSQEVLSIFKAILLMEDPC